MRRPAGQGLYEACLRARIGKGGWRRLTRWPARFLDAALELGCDEPAWAVAMAYLRFLDEAGIEEPPPGRLITALARCVLNTEREPFRFDAHLPDYWSPQLLRLALQRGCRAWRTGDPDSFVEREFLPVLLWVRDTAPRLTGHKQRHWPMYVKRARAWARAEQARLASLGKDWPVGSYPAEVMGLTVVALRNPYDLLTEGLAMRHCANRLAKACAQSGLRVFSLQDDGGWRVATVALAPACGRYELDQVKGFANSPVSAATRAAAQRLAEAYRPAPGWTPSVAGNLP